MSKYKILNLYACLGGNRYKWDEVVDNLEVTAVELDPELAKLYQEIILLQHHFKGKYVIENVIAYYEPMFNPKKRGRHLYWTNFNLPNKISRDFSMQGSNSNKEFQRLSKFHDYDFSKYKGEQSKTKIARNLVDYEAGKTILETALGIEKRENIKQLFMFP